jgi:hypothetical protein
MNRLFTLILIGFAGLLASCGSSVSSSTQPGSTGGLTDVYSMVVSPVQFTLNAGDWASITATVDVSKNNSAAKPLAPQPPITFLSSDSRVTISPAGEVCAGQWDSRFLTCTATVIPPIDPSTGLPNPNAGQPNLPTGYVTITAYNASHNVSGTSLLAVHERAASITWIPLSKMIDIGMIYTGTARINGVLQVPSGEYPLATQCVSQGNAVKYAAALAPVDASGNPIANCSVSATAGCVNNNDYTWSVDNATVAQVSNYGVVVARNPGLTNVYATLNGTVSAPLAFVTCPPSSIVLSTSAYINGPPTGPYSTADLTALNKGDRKYVTATLTDTNGFPVVTAPLTYITSDPLIGSFTAALPLTSTLTANSSGRFTMMASCGEADCNAAVADFISPAGPGTSQATGFGFPVYSNVVGATVKGTTGSTVLVTGTTLSGSVTPAHRLLVFDSESLSLIQTVSLANLPNSLVVAPNGATAYLGSSGGLMVVNLTSYEPTLRAFPVAGGLSTDVVTGTVLGVSPDSRYVLLSDVANSLVFFIDTTGTKVAQRFNIPDITSVAFAPDDSNFWIGGAAGVYVYQGDTFVLTLTNASSNVNALAWTPDGQSYFASGSLMTNYSTCQDRLNPPPFNVTSSVQGGLATTALPSAPPLPGDVPHVLGLDVNQWFDYSVTSSSEVPDQTVSLLPGQALTEPPLVPGGPGNVCQSTVTVNAPVTTASTLKCTAQQISFSPTLEQEFVTGVLDTYSPGFVTGVDTSCATPESVIHGYDVVAQKEILLTTTDPVVPLSGGALNDGRKLYFGTYDGTNGTLLHRIDLAAQTEDFVQQEVVNPTTGLPTTNPPTFVTVVPATVSVVPTFVAVVPK